ncbi:type 4 prepilin peptidase 1 . Aspartic peptidase. MEROPS family A24A [Modicisalibacter ilicicola DSM 19980]|uniref:Prepilin leader peptidase/N-methyltransferase n=1 Tax=Modicisalibacter ilicicola DSM 19980 TaxID=1121942 RepID=A0A1M5C4E3_9GAMM|nr:A24 family peptidase [Halomonas ilicicola]SHF49643.1 type 4 prepilin peptidase 1 . Aspartic peptidase. MEROPS family A24A [Halomonas ilicicola DSM 19980]
MYSDIPAVIALPLAALLGLVIGSFINVVVARLPGMLMLQWRAEAREALALPEESGASALPRINLVTPRSRCPQCGTPIAWHDNIPVLGYLKRRGRCAHCHQPISVQYPLIELAGGAMVLAVVAINGFDAASLLLSAACLILLTLALIDLRTQLLPDILTLPLLWLGLLYQLAFQPWMLESAVIGAVAGYLVLWCFYWLFKLVTGKEGMGYGDFKLLAALGAWTGWEMLPLLLILSAGVGAVVGIVVQLAIPRLRGMPLPFGPFLAMAGWITLLFGGYLMGIYQAIMLF